jgi:hypothetical protein
MLLAIRVATVVTGARVMFRLAALARERWRVVA